MQQDAHTYTLFPPSIIPYHCCIFSLVGYRPPLSPSRFMPRPPFTFNLVHAERTFNVYGRAPFTRERNNGFPSSLLTFACMHINILFVLVYEIYKFHVCVFIYNRTCICKYLLCLRGTTRDFILCKMKPHHVHIADCI